MTLAELRLYRLQIEVPGNRVLVNFWPIPKMVISFHLVFLLVFVVRKFLMRSANCIRKRCVPRLGVVIAQTLADGEKTRTLNYRLSVDTREQIERVTDQIHELSQPHREVGVDNRTTAQVRIERVAEIEKVETDKAGS